MGRPRTHDAETREDLLAAAEALLVEGGPAAITVRAVSNLAGTTTRAVYSLFGSQAGLLDVLRARAADQLASFLMAEPITDDPVEDIVRLGAGGFREFTLSRHLAYQLLSVSGDGNTPSLRFDPRALRLVVYRARRVVEAGPWDGPDGDTVAVQFLALCWGLAMMEGDGLMPDGQEHATWEGALRALVRGHGARAIPALGGLAPQHRAR